MIFPDDKSNNCTIIEIIMMKIELLRQRKVLPSQTAEEEYANLADDLGLFLQTRF